MLVFEFALSKNVGLHELSLVMKYKNICSVGLLVSIFLFPKMLYHFVFYDNFQISDTLSTMDNVDFRGSEKVGKVFKLLGYKLALYFEGKPFLRAGFNMSHVAIDTKVSYNQIALFYRIYYQVSFGLEKLRQD